MKVQLYLSTGCLESWSVFHAWAAFPPQTHSATGFSLADSISFSPVAEPNPQRPVALPQKDCFASQCQHAKAGLASHNWEALPLPAVIILTVLLSPHIICHLSHSTSPSWNRPPPSTTLGLGPRGTRISPKVRVLSASFLLPTQWGPQQSEGEAWMGQLGWRKSSKKHKSHKQLQKSTHHTSALRKEQLDWWCLGVVWLMKNCQKDLRKRCIQSQVWAPFSNHLSWS